MRKMGLRLLVVGFVLGSGLAEEGMWPPEQLPAIGKQLQAAGLELDPVRLTSLTEHPMNAVVSLGGCTASFVSPQGLVVTNHHCAYGSIQYNSSPERNLLAEGFLARSLEEELPASPGSRVYVTVEFRDVTERVVRDLSESLSGLERYQKIELREKEIVAECEKEPGFRCRVASYHGGLRYSLVRQLELRDVRLVYAPASGIGRFGGDIDNWMWPRHTGDYSFYRAYVGPDGKPADFATENVPYRPAHYLTVSSGGLEEGDFVMVAGYPGTTGRYRLAVEVKHTFQWAYPARTEAYREWLGLIESTARELPDAKIKYAGLESGLNNSLKNNQGMLDGFANSRMIEDKERLERELLDWIKADSQRQSRYGGIYEKLVEEIQSEQAEDSREFYYGLAGRSSLLSAARQLYRLAREKTKPDLERDSGYQERDVARIRQSLTALDRRYHPEVDAAVLQHFILRYVERVPQAQRVKAFDAWFGLAESGVTSERVEARLKKMYAESSLSAVDTRLGWMEKSVADFEASNDPFIQLAVQLFPSDEARRLEERERAGRTQLLRSRLMEATLAFLQSKGRSVYPDANGTLRVTFGKVTGYRPRDGVVYQPFTSLKGILEKDTGEEPFDTPPAALKAMQEIRDSRWLVSWLSSVPVNFLSTCDSTGGNSGSATLNGRGELVGLLFDGNYESMISDWDFLPEITRSIHVDIRYVLWLMQEVDRAGHLLLEMRINP